MLRRVSQKTVSDIASEWDRLAQVRFDQITNGTDITYEHVLTPAMQALVCESHPSRVLDAGCGVGVFTERLTQHVRDVVGIDPSGTSIRVAKDASTSSVLFLQSTLEEFSAQTDMLFDCVIANMVLMDVLNLSEFLRAARSVLCPSGRLIFSLTHPCFWPAYYGYENEVWFNYADEVVIEGPFRISGATNGTLVSTHVHRPLNIYFNALVESNFVLKGLFEPLPQPEIETKYPTKWEAPRYLLGYCVAV